MRVGLEGKINSIKARRPELLAELQSRLKKAQRVVAVLALRPMQAAKTKLGAIGVDINANHLAVSETDRFGNLVHIFRIDLHTYGKTTDQAKALIGDAAVQIAERAKGSAKPIVLEKLDFSKKKAELEAAHKPLARMLSSFACNKTLSSIKAAAFHRGVEVIEVNPAYTSVIGAVNHAQKNGISVHMGAALAIARTELGLTEKPPKRGAIVPAV